MIGRRKNMSVHFKPDMKPYKNLGSFRMWCQKVLPAVYDESLSYYEVLCKLKDYLNEVIENVDGLYEDMDALYNAYGLLEDYVNSYFDNLNVQTEINNKLDAMALDGSLSALISPFVTALLPDEVASRISAVVESQLPAVVRVQLPPELASQLPTEVALQIPDLVTAWLNLHIVQPVEVIIDDSLTISGAAADAKTVGDAISELKSALTNIEHEYKTYYINRFNENDLYDGRVESDGTITIYGTYKHSSPIPVNELNSYSFYRWTGTVWRTPTIYSIATYDDKLEFIENLGNQSYSGDADSKIDIPSNAHFVVLSFEGSTGYSGGMFIDYSASFPIKYFDYTKITIPIDCYYLLPEMFGAVGDGVTDDTNAFEKMLYYVTNETCVCTKSYLITQPLIINNINFLCYGSIYCKYGIIFQNMNHKNILIESIYGENRIYSEVFGVTISNCHYTNFVFGIIDYYTNGILLKADGYGCDGNIIDAKRVKCINGIVFLNNNDGWINGNKIRLICNPIEVSEEPLDADFYAIDMTGNNTNNSFNSNTINLLYEWHYDYFLHIAKLIKMSKSNGNKINVERLEITGVESTIDDFVVFGELCINNEVVANQFVYVSADFSCKNNSAYLNRAIFSETDKILEGFRWIKQDMCALSNLNCVDRNYKLARINNENKVEVVEEPTGVNIEHIDGEVWSIGTLLQLKTKDIESDSFIMFRGKGFDARCNLRLGNASDSPLGISYILTTQNDILNNNVSVYGYYVNPNVSSSIFRSNNNIALVDSMLHIKSGVGYINLIVCGFVDEIGLSDNLVILNDCLK